jgi:hypothetical protein
MIENKVEKWIIWSRVFLTYAKLINYPWKVNVHEIVSNIIAIIHTNGVVKKGSCQL